MSVFLTLGWRRERNWDPTFSRGISRKFENLPATKANFEMDLFAARLVLALPAKNGPMRMETGTTAPLALLDFM